MPLQITSCIIRHFLVFVIHVSFCNIYTAPITQLPLYRWEHITNYWCLIWLYSSTREDIVFKGLVPHSPDVQGPRSHEVHEFIWVYWPQVKYTSHFISLTCVYLSKTKFTKAANTLPVMPYILVYIFFVYLSLKNLFLPLLPLLLPLWSLQSLLENSINRSVHNLLAFLSSVSMNDCTPVQARQLLFKQPSQILISFIYRKSQCRHRR